MLKTVVLLTIFVKTVIFFKFFVDWSLKEQHLFDIETFYNIINVFTVTFNQFTVSLLNKSINYLKKVF